MLFDLVQGMSLRIGAIVPIEEIQKSVTGLISKRELDESLWALTKSNQISRPRKEFVMVKGGQA